MESKPHIKMVKQLHQPAELESLAKKEIISMIIYQGRKKWQINNELFSPQIEIVRKCFKNAPGRILYDLLEQLMDEIENLQKKAVFAYTGTTLSACEPFPIERMIEILLNENLSTVSFTESRIRMYKEIFCSQSHILTSLKTVKLNLESNVQGIDYSINNLESITVDILRRLPSPEYLVLTSCNDDILRYIAENCKDIKQLDIHGYHLLSVETLDMLSQLPKLRTINLYESEYVLWSSNEIEQKKNEILQYISLRKQFKIRSYLFANDSKIEDMLLVIEKYPDIESFKFIGSNHHNLRKNMGLKSLKKLENQIKLIIDFTDYYGDEVEGLIRLFGTKVKTLHLEKVANMDLQSIQLIGEICPYLENLTISDSQFVEYEVIPSEIENPLFQNLKTISISKYYSEYNSYISPVEKTWNTLILIYLLKNCPNIEIIDMENIDCTKNFMMQVLNGNSMTCLRDLRLSQKLEDVVIDRMIENGLSPRIMYYSSKAKLQFYSEIYD